PAGQDSSELVPSMGAIITRYRDGLLFFAPRLKPADAERLARDIVAYSNRYGVDARLVVAVLVTEGSIPRIRSRSGGLLVGREPAAEVVETLCRDLRQRLDHGPPNGTGVTIQEIERALTAPERARGGAPGPAPPPPR